MASYCMNSLKMCSNPAIHNPKRASEFGHPCFAPRVHKTDIHINCALLSKFIFCSFFVQCSFNYSERFGKLILSGGRVSFVIKSINSINIYIQYSYKVLPEFVYFFSVSAHTYYYFSFSLLSYTNP